MSKKTSSSFLFAIRLFFLMFVYFFLSKIYLYKFGFKTEYGVIIFFFALFLFGFSFLPLKSDRKSLFSWLTFLSFLLISIGGGISFTLAFAFNLSVDNFYIIMGIISFFVGIFMLIISIFTSKKS
jgi:hypothetical protein